MTFNVPELVPLIYTLAVLVIFFASQLVIRYIPFTNKRRLPLFKYLLLLGCAVAGFFLGLESRGVTLVFWTIAIWNLALLTPRKFGEKWFFTDPKNDSSQEANQTASSPKG